MSNKQPIDIRFDVTLEHPHRDVLAALAGPLHYAHPRVNHLDAQVAARKILVGAVATPEETLLVARAYATLVALVSARRRAEKEIEWIPGLSSQLLEDDREQAEKVNNNKVTTP